jgi:uncharacterized FlaG/YvyC family protein
MDFVKPVSGVLSDAQGQGAAAVEIIRERYRQQQAREVPNVKAGDESQPVVERRRRDGEQEAVALTSTLRHVYADFEVDHSTREVTMRLFDADTGELVRTIPADQLADEILKGSFVPNHMRIRTVLA